MERGQSAPRYRGVRRPWSDLPPAVLAEFEAWAGAPVVSAATQPGGYSPGIAARVTTAAGRRLFVKAACSDPNPGTPELHRREASVAAALPLSAPAPRLLWMHDEGPPGWILLCFEDVDGRLPAEPWVKAELERVLAAVRALSEALTPSPLTLEPAGELMIDIAAWRRLRAAPEARLSGWPAANLSLLAQLDADAPEAVAGDTLLHLDLRSDNLLLTPHRVVVVDWPWARVGAAWLDVVLFAPTVTVHGGPEPEQVLLGHPAAATARPRSVSAAIAAFAGYLTWQSLQPPQAGLPTVRRLQAATAEVAVRWLARRVAAGLI